MRFKVEDRKDVEVAKRLFRASRNFDVLSRIRFEVQFKLIEISHFASYFSIEPARIVDVDTGYEGHRK